MTSQHGVVNTQAYASGSDFMRTGLLSLVTDLPIYVAANKKTGSDLTLNRF
jgi:hypothetical protein